MLDYLIGACLFILIIAQGYLIRGCFGIKNELPLQGGAIGSRIDKTADLIDEVAQLISDFSDAALAGKSPQPVASPMEAILTSLISNMQIPTNYAEKVEEREIYPTNENPPQVEAETEPN